MEDGDSALARTDAFWREWSGRCTYDGEYRDEVLTSLIALKAMTDEITGAVVAAPPRFRRTSAGFGTGTTATAGCAIRC